MPASKSGGTLQIDEHLNFQRKLGLTQRIGWGLLFVGLVAAAAGVFGGGGPLASTTANADALQVFYPRFGRYGAPLQMEIEVPTGAIGQQPFSIVIGGGYGSELQIGNIIPEPRRVLSSERGFVLEFAPAPGEQQVIRIDGKTDALGTLTGEISLGQRPPVQLRSFIYP